MQQDDSQLLMLALAEQLKTPLLQITHMSESGTAGLTDIATVSRYALNLVDAYTLASAQTGLDLEPMTTASVLYEVAHSIDPVAKQLNYHVQIDMRGVNKPVMAHKQTLKDMLFLLSTSMMQSGLEEESANYDLVLGTHRAATGTVVGAFCDSNELTQKSLNLARQLRGRAAQSVPAMGASGGTALAVAEKLSHRLEAPLKVYRHNALSGIGSLLAHSAQLKLV